MPRIDPAVQLYRDEKRRRREKLRRPMREAREVYRRMMDVHPNSPKNPLGKAFMRRWTV